MPRPTIVDLDISARGHAEVLGRTFEVHGPIKVQNNTIFVSRPQTNGAQASRDVRDTASVVACTSRRPERVPGGAPWAAEECGGARVFAQLWQLRQWLTGLPRCSGHCERARGDIETARTRFRDDSGCAMGSSGHGGGAPHSHAVAARRLDRSYLNEQSHRPRTCT